MNCENQELIWFKFHSCNNILNSEGNRIVSWKIIMARHTLQSMFLARD